MQSNDDPNIIYDAGQSFKSETQRMAEATSGMQALCSFFCLPLHPHYRQRGKRANRRAHICMLCDTRSPSRAHASMLQLECRCATSPATLTLPIILRKIRPILVALVSLSRARARALSLSDW
jgi:hypothetical protein